MRTTVELPDELLGRAKSCAAIAGVSLKLFFIEAVEMRLSGEARKTRREPPSIGTEDGPKIGVLTAEEIDEAMFG